MSGEDLITRLRGHSALFLSMVELIPAKHYVMKDLDEGEVERLTKFHQNRSRSAPRQAVKEATKKAKRLRLDPLAQKSIQQLQAEVGGCNATEKGENDEPVPETFSVEKIKSVNLEELRERLRKKMDELRSKSNRPPKKTEGKSRKNTRKTKQEGKARKGPREKKSANRSKSLPKVERKSALNSDEDRVMFSRFDFSSSEPGEWKRQQRKVDYKKLLRQAKERSELTQDLMEVDEQKAGQMQETFKWRQAIDKAVGAKKKDDPKLLQKTIKRREKLKKRSQQKWQEKEQQLEEQKKKKQAQKDKHLKERIELKKAKSLGRKTKTKKKTRTH